MAEAFFNSAVKASKELSNEFSASSAGISAVNGLPASENSICVLRDNWGIDLTSHRSRAISEDEIKDAFLIFTMTNNHKNMLQAAFPHTKSKVYTLKEFVQQKKQYGSEGASSPVNDIDITDPFGKPLEVYQECASEIKAAVDALIERLKKYYS